MCFVTKDKTDQMRDYLAESIKAVTEKWDKYSILKGIESHLKPNFAVCLEAQRLANELVSDSSETAFFKRISIPLVRRALAASRLFAERPMVVDMGVVDYDEYEFCFVVEIPKVNKWCTYGALDREAEQTVMLTEKFTTAIDELIEGTPREQHLLFDALRIYPHVSGDRVQHFAMTFGYKRMEYA